MCIDAYAETYHKSVHTKSLQKPHGAKNTFKRQLSRFAHTHIERKICKQKLKPEFTRFKPQYLCAQVFVNLQVRRHLRFIQK